MRKQFLHDNKPETIFGKDLKETSCHWTIGLRRHISDVMFLFAGFQPASEHWDPGFEVDPDAMSPECTVKLSSCTLSALFISRLEKG
jgi:hypothetical protein